MLFRVGFYFVIFYLDFYLKVSRDSRKVCVLGFWPNFENHACLFYESTINKQNKTKQNKTKAKQKAKKQNNNNNNTCTNTASRLPEFKTDREFSLDYLFKLI